MIPDEERPNYETFRDCLSEPILRQLAAPPPQKQKKRKSDRGRKTSARLKDATTQKQVHDDGAGTQADAEELADFIEYLASEIFEDLPREVRTLSFHEMQTSSALRDAYTEPLPDSTIENLMQTISPSIADSLGSYSLLSPPDDLSVLTRFLTPPLTAYIASVTAAPPATYASKSSATHCELCERDWVPLTYHHLIPRAVHEKAVKRGWHTEAELNTVAWLCRACHSFVHRIASHEELAREWYSVERLLMREDVEKWVQWVGRIRWKAR